MSRRPRRRSSWLCESVSPLSSHWLPSHRLLLPTLADSRDRSFPVTHVIGRLFPVLTPAATQRSLLVSFLVAALSSVHHASFSFFPSQPLGIPHLWRSKIYVCRQLRRLRQEIECDTKQSYRVLRASGRTQSTLADHSEIFESLTVRGLYIRMSMMS